jgi:predicted RNA-binding Zn ribbon-like protein
MLNDPENGATNRREFIFVGENPAIDFANTLVPPPGPGIDFLRAWPDAIDWLARAKLSKDASLNLPVALRAAALKEVLDLRQAWRDVLASLLAGGKVSEDFLARLNDLLATNSFHEALHRHGKSQFHLVHSESQLHGDKLVLAILARQIALFLADANLRYLRRCANNISCVLYFYDTTKNHRRRWCSVATCGNRYKVAAFRRRQRNRG